MPGALCSSRALEAVDVLRTALETMPSREMEAEDVHGFAAGVGFSSKVGINEIGMYRSIRRWVIRLSNRVPIIVQRKWSALPPAGVYLIGSLATETAVGSDVIVDVAIEMPSACFEGKDHLNHRYHVKRALYLTAVVAHLKKRGFEQTSWVLVNHDARSVPRSLLRMLPAHDPDGELFNQCNPCTALACSRRPAVRADIKLHDGSIAVRLLAFPADGAIDIRKLGPDRNALRAVCTSSLPDGPQLLPTPQYNMGILQVRDASVCWFDDLSCADELVV